MTRLGNPGWRSVRAVVSTFEATSDHDDPPSPYQRRHTRFVTSGMLELSKLSENEIVYIKVNDFTKPVMPRAQIWRVIRSEASVLMESDQVTSEIIIAAPSKYWLIELRGSADAVQQIDAVLMESCKYVCIHRKSPPYFTIRPDTPPSAPTRSVESTAGSTPSFRTPLSQSCSPKPRHNQIARSRSPEKSLALKDNTNLPPSSSPVKSKPKHNAIDKEFTDLSVPPPTITQRKKALVKSIKSQMYELKLLEIQDQISQLSIKPHLEGSPSMTVFKIVKTSYLA